MYMYYMYMYYMYNAVGDIVCACKHEWNVPSSSGMVQAGARRTRGGAVDASVWRAAAAVACAM